MNLEEIAQALGLRMGRKPVDPPWGLISQLACMDLDCPGRIEQLCFDAVIETSWGPANLFEQDLAVMRCGHCRRIRIRPTQEVMEALNLVQVLALRGKRDDYWSQGL